MNRIDDKRIDEKCIDEKRREIMTSAVFGFASRGVLVSIGPLVATPGHAAQATTPGRGLGPLQHVRAEPLDVAYHDLGPRDGTPVILLHGFPYDVHSYQDVAPMLAARGCRVVVPYLRGHRATHFVDPSEPRSGQQGAIGADVIALMDALQMPDAILAGYDWGGRAACVVAALWPQRCRGLVSVNGYLIQNIAAAAQPAAARVEWGLWYQHYFQSERGRRGLVENRRDIARILWERNSPTWAFDEQTFERSASAFDHPDFVDVVIHSYRHRLGAADGIARYADIERRLAALPVIAAPTITLDGDADGVVAATDGSAQAKHFSQRLAHRIVPGAGHNLPQEAPEAFVRAVLDLVAATG
ncbi:alpha/beta hydrolase [Lysobacter sp. Root690]|uniref:alpha/beta fold hydrolase n=1 Tax=Lysobacter sp. Root690 TaxID=1736588 RepID=UPI000B02444B|nr:alpha/beta hydrolase [Lysobacter sp. Root690]